MELLGDSPTSQAIPTELKYLQILYNILPTSYSTITYFTEIK